jgi:hypothetical protein
MPLFRRRPADPVSRLMTAARLPTAGGPIPVRDVAMDVLGRNSRRAPAVLGVVEDLLAEGDDISWVALDFLEDLQNVASHGMDGLLTVSQLEPLCGPRTLAAWAMIDRFWSDVVAWCDANAVELESAQSLQVFEHPSLRSIMLPMFRTLTDGRLVGLSDVVRYERAVGLFMTESGPHSVA